MKKIFTIIAAIMCAASLYAQGEAGTIEVSKTVKDNENGTYTVTLEAFTTGSMVQTIVTNPCDIILVLDNTSSMYKTNMDGTTRDADKQSTLSRTSRIEALINAVAKDGGFIDSIYDSAVDGSVNHKIAIVEFKGGIPRSGDYKPSTSSGAWWTNHDLVFWDSDLTYKRSKNQTGPDYPVTSTMSEWGESLTDWVSLGAGANTAKEAIKAAINKTDGVFDYCERNDDAANVEDGGTPSGSALVRAKQLLNDDSIKNDGNPKLVIFFTDGQCGYGATWDQYNRSMAAEVVKQANLLKQIPNTSIYTIGVFGELTEGTQETKDTYGYLNHVSSKFSSEITISGGKFSYSETTATATAAPDNTNVFTASNESELNSAFNRIAQDVENISEPYDLGENSAVVLDVMTNVFKLPAGATTDDVSLYTCSTETNNPLNNDPIWKTDATGKEIWTPFTGTVSFGKDSEGADEVLVSGFDYSQHYVGKNYDGETPTSWRSEGKKLIIQFNIVPSQANPGGLDVQTNKATSGVYKTDEHGKPTGDPVARFEVPAVQLPYLEIIMKGLEVGESAAFLVTRRNADGSLDTSDTAYYAKVLITRTGNEAEGEFPHAFLKLLTSGNYLVEQIGWSWAYTPYYLNPGTSVEVQGSSLTQTMHTVVPGSKPDEFLVYTFINHTNTGTADHAEDYQPNNMGDGVVPDPGTQGGGNDNPETDPFA